MLPEACATHHPVSGKAIMIIREMQGYFGLPNVFPVAEFNDKMKATDEVKKTMLRRSMFGWDKE
jgi:hypothetical protein